MRRRIWSRTTLVTHKRLGYLTMLGMLKGENEYTYPPYNEVQARELIDCLRESLLMCH